MENSSSSLDHRKFVSNAVAKMVTEKRGHGDATRREALGGEPLGGVVKEGK
jgi:hypothetical protein